VTVAGFLHATVASIALHQASFVLGVFQRELDNLIFVHVDYFNCGLKKMIDIYIED
jgi:hypothetical protein